MRRRRHLESQESRMDRCLAAIMANPTLIQNKQYILSDTDVLPSPSGLAAASLAGAVVFPGGLATRSVEPVTRRQFFRRAAIAGGVVGVLLYGSNQKAGAWGFVGAAVFGAAIGWFVNKIMDWGWYKLTADDLTETRSPAPTNSKFHNSYAPNYEVSNLKKHFRARTVCEYDTPFGMKEFQLSVELNYPEAAQIKKEVEAGIYDEPILPVGYRLPVTEKLKPAAQKVASGYKFRPGDYDPEYITVLADKNGKEHLGVGAKINGKDKYMLL